MFNKVKIYESTKVFSWHDFLDANRFDKLLEKGFIPIKTNMVEVSRYPDGKCQVWYKLPINDRFGNEIKNTSKFSGIWFTLGRDIIVVYDTIG